MKKSLILALAATTMAACTNDVDYSSSDQGNPNNTIGFQVLGRNSITRAQSLQDAGHYNFGVFAYKSSDNVNNVMSNYLVGYMDDAKGYKKSGSTTGDQPGVADGQSYWMYEGLGNKEYFGTYAGGALDTFYTSNNARQFLKYWDKSAEFTCFYAYAPYVGTTDAGKNLRVTYVDGQEQSATGGDTYVMNIPNGTIVAGYDDASRYEFMYASAKVLRAEYGHDVSLDFNRLVAKVNIKFWEDIPGYKVRIIDLDGNTYKGVQAAASIKEPGVGIYGYKGGKYYVSNGVKIQFIDGKMTGIKQYKGETKDNNIPLVFDAPTAAQIGDNRYTASASATTYYAIPKGSSANVLANNSTNFSADGTAPEADLALTGFTFHVSYELTAEDSGERIIVKNATVHVPCNYCNWKENTHYTYIFKITTNSNGSSETDPEIKPTDPEVPTVQSLYPIVFDNCTVQDWDENESEWEITEGTGLSYHNITLSKYSLVSGTITVNINDDDKHNDHNHTLDYSAVKVYGPNDETADVTSTMYNSDAKTIAVAAGTQAGLYTVVYTCPGTDKNGNHPTTWKAHFVVGNEYQVKTHHTIIGCNGTEVEAKLNVTATKDGDPYALSTTDLKIDYPANFEDDQKENVTIEGTDVVVKRNATPGVYKVVLTIDEGSAVKVAEKTFEVKDFNFDINPNVVLRKGTDVVITCSQWNNDITAQEYTTTLSTVTVNDNKIIVPNGSAEDTYKITYITWNGTDSEGNEDAAKVTYTKTFEVRNTHSVTVGAQLDRNFGTSNEGEYSTKPIEIKTIVNGNATDTDLTDKLSIVKSDKTVTDDDDFKITYKSGNTYELTCKKTVAPGNYYVKFMNTVAGADAPEYAPFVVVE